MIPLIIGIVAALGGLALGAALMSRMTQSRTVQAQDTLQEAQQHTADLSSNLEARERELQLEAREQVQREVAKLRETIERETAERRAELKEAERRMREREVQLERRGKNLDGREKAIEQKDGEAQAKIDAAQALVERQKLELERVAQLPTAQAREILLERVRDEVQDEMIHVARRIEDEAREHAEEKARKIVALAIQRCAVDQTAESSVSVVPLPADDLKGRIIGREGRNIRTFEQLSGTDLIIDDTPEAVVVSCFDPVRREIAKMALASLVNDGRIHPARIEEMLAKAKTDVSQKMREAGDKATADAGVRLARPVLEVFGRLLYRTSYGQNILKHSVEVSQIAATIGAELGADVQVCKRAGLLHDIGKALDAEHEGTHVDLGSELLRRHRENEAVVKAAEEHHLDVGQMSSLESVVVQIADAISSSRPGARRENLETYIKRLQNLERIADSFEGVDKSYAIQAGREVRIIVKPERVDDVSALRLAREVAQRIQEEMTYPGEIKVTVIREMRSVDYAR